MNIIIIIYIHTFTDEMILIIYLNADDYIRDEMMRDVTTDNLYECLEEVCNDATMKCKQSPM